MNIDKLTIGEAKAIAKAVAAMFGDESQKTTTPHIGKKCIVRTYASGVHFGTLTEQQDRRVELVYARRLWRWDAAPNGISLSEIANNGPVGKRSRLCEVVEAITILDALEIIPTTEEAAKVIEAAAVYKP